MLIPFWKFSELYQWGVPLTCTSLLFLDFSDEFPFSQDDRDIAIVFDFCSSFPYPPADMPHLYVTATQECKLLLCAMLYSNRFYTPAEAPCQFVSFIPECHSLMSAMFCSSCLYVPANTSHQSIRFSPEYQPLLFINQLMAAVM